MVIFLRDTNRTSERFGHVATIPASLGVVVIAIAHTGVATVLTRETVQTRVKDERQCLTSVWSRRPVAPSSCVSMSPRRAAY